MVAEIDMTISRNIALVNKSLNVAPRCLSVETCCTPLIVKKTAANCSNPTKENQNPNDRRAPTVLLWTHRHVKSKDGKADEG